MECHTLKVFIEEQDWFPVYQLDTGYGQKEVEVSQDLYDRFLSAMTEFDAIQEELAEIYKVN